MSGWSPPTVPRQWVLGLGIAYVLFVAYVTIIRAQVLLAVVPGVVALSTYLLWRFLRAVEAIADALQRIAAQQEEE